MSAFIDSIESDLLPFADTIQWNQGKLSAQAAGTMEKVRYYAFHGIGLLVKTFFLPSALICLMLKRLSSHFIQWYNPPMEELKPLPEYFELGSALPPLVGFADSLYQSSLLGTPYSATCKKGTSDPLEGTSYWTKNLDEKHIEGSPDISKFGVDILGDPDRFIDMLRATNSNAYRFPIPWSIIETLPGIFNQENISLLRSFITKLKAAGIEPLVTIHHYDHPAWFEEMGGFHNLENVEKFKNHALDMIRMFPEIRTWYTFNEIGGFGLETFLGDFPAPDHVYLNHAAEGRLLRNILIAHCKTYQAAKAEFGDRIEIGATHQFLGFRPINGNWVEEMVCRHLSKISGEAVYDFFKTGIFRFQIPGFANVNFEIPEEEFERNHRFLDVLGVQAYGDARFVFGMNGGVPYPGPKVNNICWGPFGFSAGATCEDGKRVSSFGPEIDPTTLRKVLEKACAITNKIHITEIGCDAKSQIRGDIMKLDRDTQKKYFEDIAPILAQFRNQIEAFLVWTLFGGVDGQEGQLEWQRGKETNLPLLEVTRGPDRKIEEYQLSPAAELLKESFARAQAKTEEPQAM